MESQWLFNLLLVLSFSLLLMSMIWSFVLTRKLSKTMRLQQESEMSLKKQIQVLASGSIGVGRRLVAIEKKLNIAVERQSEILSKEGGVSYNRSMELLDMGATVDDLVAKCGLIRAEAELIDLLFKESKRSTSQ